MFTPKPEVAAPTASVAALQTTAPVLPASAESQNGAKGLLSTIVPVCVPVTSTRSMASQSPAQSLVFRRSKENFTSSAVNSP